MAVAAAMLALPPTIAGAAEAAKLPPSKYQGDCSGETPVVVASDTAAQSDIYSAVTLAGVLRTNCVVLAGERGVDMAAAQQSRLEAAADGGYVVGGKAAVSDCKVRGREMVRLAGSSRWQTAELVGTEAQRIADGNPSTPRAIPERACDFPPKRNRGDSGSSGSSTGYKAIAVQGDGLVCALRGNGTLTCWGQNYANPSNPGGTYKIVAPGRNHSCAIATNSTLACWGNGDNDKTSAPEGRYKAVAAGGSHSCAIRTNGSLLCWGSNSYGQSNAPPIRFKAVAAGEIHTCAIKTDDTLACWGYNSYGVSNPPEGRFKAIAARSSLTCAIRANDTLACWGRSPGNTPPGSFKAVAPGWVSHHACALGTNNTVACWGNNGSGQANAPEGSFKALGVSEHHSCAIRTNGKALCWGRGYTGITAAPAP